MGRRRLGDRIGATEDEMRRSLWSVVSGMFFSSLVMYFVMLATASTLFVAGRHSINSAVDAAEALRPIAGNAASALFALGIVGVGFLAVPVMTTGGAYDVAQALGWRQGLHRKPGESKGLLRCHRRPHPARDRDELSWRQCHEGAGLVRHRTGLFDSAADAADSPNDEQPQDHGRTDESPRHKRRRVDHDWSDVRRDGRARRELADLIERDAVGSKAVTWTGRVNRSGLARERQLLYGVK
jgi:hypothetical protein